MSWIQKLSEAYRTGVFNCCSTGCGALRVGWWIVMGYGEASSSSTTTTTSSSTSTTSTSTTTTTTTTASNVLSDSALSGNDCVSMCRMYLLIWHPSISMYLRQAERSSMSKWCHRYSLLCSDMHWWYIHSHAFMYSQIVNLIFQLLCKDMPWNLLASI